MVGPFRHSKGKAQLTYDCDVCGWGIRFAPDQAGLLSKCPRCDSTIRLPGVPEPPPVTIDLATADAVSRTRSRRRRVNAHYIAYGFIAAMLVSGVAYALRYASGYAGVGRPLIVDRLYAMDALLASTYYGRDFLALHDAIKLEYANYCRDLSPRDVGSVGQRAISDAVAKLEVFKSLWADSLSEPSDAWLKAYANRTGRNLWAEATADMVKFRTLTIGGPWPDQQTKVNVDLNAEKYREVRGSSNPWDYARIFMADEWKAEKDAERERVRLVFSDYIDTLKAIYPP